MTAEERGQQMMLVKMKDLPPLALEFCQDLCSRVGGCMETFLTAWTVYAQCVEGLPCTDDLYMASESDKQWFRERQAKEISHE